jgi:glycine/D-amino acid oxidase-like deaminating enzyme
MKTRAFDWSLTGQVSRKSTASTKDGLAYVGKSPEYPGCYFTLGFGGNGITFSVIATNLISELVRGQQLSDAHLFRFGQ